MSIVIEARGAPHKLIRPNAGLAQRLQAKEPQLNFLPGHYGKTVYAIRVVEGPSSPYLVVTNKTQMYAEPFCYRSIRNSAYGFHCLADDRSETLAPDGSIPEPMNLFARSSVFAKEWVAVTENRESFPGRRSAAEYPSAHLREKLLQCITTVPGCPGDL